MLFLTGCGVSVRSCRTNGAQGDVPQWYLLSFWETGPIDPLTVLKPIVLFEDGPRYCAGDRLNHIITVEL